MRVSAFMRGLLENAGADINPLRIIRRIKDDLEVPGLKDALVKILQASNLQVSLLEGCQKILAGDTSSYASQFQRSQTNGAFATGRSLEKEEIDHMRPKAYRYLIRQHSLSRLR